MIINTEFEYIFIDGELFAIEPDDTDWKITHEDNFLVIVTKEEYNGRNDTFPMVERAIEDAIYLPLFTDRIIGDSFKVNKPSHYHSWSGNGGDIKGFVFLEDIKIQDKKTIVSVNCGDFNVWVSEDDFKVFIETYDLEYSYNIFDHDLGNFDDYEELRKLVELRYMRRIIALYRSWMTY